MTRAVESPMPGEVGQRAVGGPVRQLVRVGGRGRPPAPATQAFVLKPVDVGPIQAVDDPLQGFDGGHRARLEAGRRPEASRGERSRSARRDAARTGSGRPLASTVAGRDQARHTIGRPGRARAGPRAGRVRAGARRRRGHRGPVPPGPALRAPPDGVLRRRRGRRRRWSAMAVWFLNFSTWLGRHGIYLEDLYVTPGPPRRRPREGAARPPRPPVRRRRLRAARVVRARLEHARHRLLRRSRRTRRWTSGRRTASPATPSPPWPGRQPGRERRSLTGPHGTLRPRRPPQRRASPRCSTPSPAATRPSPPIPFSTTETQHRRRPGARRAARRAGRDEPSRRRWSTPPPSSSTSPGSRRARRRARGSATGSSAASARSTPSATCCGPSRDDNVPGDTDPLDDLTTLELELVLADVASVESQLDKRRKAATGRQVAGRRGRRARAGRRATCTTPPRSTGPGSTDEDRALLQPYFLLTTKPVLAVVNLGEDDLDARRREVVAPVAGELDGVAEVLGRLRPARGGGSAPRRRRADRAARRASASARARCPGSSARRTTCSGCGRSSPPGDKESRAWTVPGRRQGPGVRRA